MKSIMKVVFLLMIQLLSKTTSFSQEVSESIINTSNSDIRNIEFFYIVNDSTKDQCEHDWGWSACVQLLYSENDSTRDHVFIVNEIDESPLSTSFKIDAKIIQALNNIGDSFKKGVLEINYKKIQSFNNTLSSYTTSIVDAESKVNSLKEPCLVKIYYFKRENNYQDNVVVLSDKVILKLIWHQEPIVREYLLSNSKKNVTNQVKVLIL